MKRSLIASLTLFGVLGLTLIGCNIFSPFSSEGTHVEKGRTHLRNGEYTQAIEEFQKAIDEDPLDSEALYGHAKAVVYESGYNAFELATILTDEDVEGIPFHGAEWPVERAEGLYQVMQTVEEDLKPIYDGDTHGRYNRDNIQIDYAIALACDGIVSFRDTDLNEHITKDDFEFIFEEGQGAFEFTNLVDFFNRPTAKAPGKMTIGQQDLDTLIFYFNNLIDHIAEVIGGSRDIITEILQEEFGFDIEEVDELLNKVIATAQYYKVADGIDNDGNNGADEEEIDGDDEDGDGLIDEDSEYPSHFITGP